MSREGDTGMESGSSSENPLSPRSGKRMRDEKDVLLPCVEARDLDFPGGNMREDQATSEENLTTNFQPGKRMKSGSDAKLEKDPENRKANISKKGRASDVEEDTPFVCNVCSVNCTSKKDYDTHIAGKRHARAATEVKTPRSVKSTKKSGMGAKAKVPPVTLHADVPVNQQAMVDGSVNMPLATLHADVSVKQHAMVDGSVNNFDQAGKGNLPSCSDLEVADLQVFRTTDKTVGKDMVVEQQDLNEGIFVETLGSESLKNEPTSKVALHDQGNGIFVEPLTNGHYCHNVHVDGVAKCSTDIDDQNNKSILDSARCKSNSDGIARALAAAYQACACPGLEDLLKSGTHDQAAGCAVSQAAGTLGASVTAGMVSMHTQCFMNLLHDVQVKGMEDLFLRVIREERGRGFVQEPCLRGFTPEPRLPNGALISAMPPGEHNLNCTVCRVEYGSKSDLDRHVAGKKHISLVTRLHSRCHLCNVNCNSEKDYEKHVKGKKHASKLRLVQKRLVI